MVRVFAVMSVLLLLVACGPKRYDFAPLKVNDTSQMRVPADTAQPPSVPDLPPRDLFLQGYDAFRSGDRDMALRYFLAVIERYPETPELSDAAYNAGLLYQRLDQHDKALAVFARVVESGSGKDITDARFRMLISFTELERWEAMLTVIELMTRHTATMVEDDRLELYARRGVALFHLGRIEQAETLFVETFYDYEIGLRRGDVVNEIPGFLCSYYMGMIERSRFDAIVLQIGTQAQMMTLLGKRALHLQHAQDWFLKCIQQNNVYWATAAGHQIGSLYRDFFQAIRDVGIPPELNGPDEIRMYRCMLFDQVKVLLRKAMRIYEHTLSIGLRQRASNRWLDETRRDLDEVENLYLEEEKACEDVLPPEGVPGILGP